VILNRRTLLATIGLTLPALASAEAATTTSTATKKKTTVKKPKSPTSGAKVAHKTTHKTKAATPAQS
jgi:hypothetical protein